MNIMKAKTCFLTAYVDFMIVDTHDKGNRLVMASIFSRDTLLKGFAANAQKNQIVVYNKYNFSISTVETENYFTVRNTGTELVNHAVMRQIDTTDINYIFCTKDNQYDVIYDYLMNTFDYPLLKEWIPHIVDEAIKKQELKQPCTIYKSDGSTKTIPLYGKKVDLEDLIIYRSYMSRDWLDKTIEELFHKGIIRITKFVQNPLKILREKQPSLDNYMKDFGYTIVENLAKELKPLSDFNYKVENLALKKKKLFPAQANAVAGAVKLLKNSNYAIINEGMGCGKSLQAAAIVEAYYVEKWLNAHPKKTLKDAYKDPNAINYRVVLMCPGHLVKKWKAEIEKEIPYAKATILHKFSDVTKIKKNGYARQGKEFFIASKEFFKLGSTYRPTPVKFAEKKLPLWHCPVCENEHDAMEHRHNRICSCGNKHWIRKESDKICRGLICPECHEVLVNVNEIPFLPSDFANKTMYNSKCIHCGCKLWTPSVSNINGKRTNLVNRKYKWYQVSHYTNKTHKTRTTSWVLRKNEDVLYSMKSIEAQYVTKAKKVKSRKIASADYIHRQLKGYFDFCILDELHMYKGAGTAQGNAMHSLIKASKKTLGLTGTIAGGYSEDLFYILFRLDPQRMIERGFQFHKVSAFSDIYGTRVAEFSVKDDGYCNKSSRGRQLSAKKTKPGISPLIFGDFLIDKTLFLDISDMSKHLPTLTEEIRLVEANPKVKEIYDKTLDILKQESGYGITPLSSQMLHFSISFLDKPYGYGTILNPKTGDVVVCPKNYRLKKNELLPKEQEMIDIINQEMSEDRNVFVYCEATRSENTKITERLKEIIEQHCNLRGKVEILESSSPEPAKREEWLKNKAVEGKKVIICNPACVETGLDFIFEEDGVIYTYPTLIFFQNSYNLFTLWQASRRAYRLNQIKDCRTYYLAYKNTVQQSILSTMAEKQIATNAIQGGKFSAQGLQAMANGVDARLKMIKALNEQSYLEEDGDMLQKQFNLLNSHEYDEDEQDYDMDSVLGFYDLIDITKNIISNAEIKREDNSIIEQSPPAKEDVSNTLTIADIFSINGIHLDTSMIPSDGFGILMPKTKKKRKQKVPEGQLSLFDMY